jgi:hypothetical protein
MRQAAKRGLLTVMATGSVLASTAGYAAGLAYAGSGADGTASDSPGVASGNAVQVPVSVPVNACGNTVNVIGVLNPAYGNHCGNDSRRSGGTAKGGASNSPGVGSGNAVQVPVDVPVNLCGNSVNAPGAVNPAFGNGCANHGESGSVSGGSTGGDNPGPSPSHSCPCGTNGGGSGGSTGGEQPPPPQGGGTPSVSPTASPTGGEHHSPPPPNGGSTGGSGGGGQVLAETGGGNEALVLAPVGALVTAGGVLLYRRTRRPAK